MTEIELALPEVVSQEEWLRERLRLLDREKEFTHARDALNAERRRLPMVEITKDYMFHGPEGDVSLLALFEGRRQLIVYHFMFHPDWIEGCPGCSFLIDNIGHLAHLHARNTTLVAVSRAPLDRITPYKSRMGWTLPWYSSYGSDFNYDFQVTLDSSRGAVEHNFRVLADLNGSMSTECPGTSVFLREGDRIFHTYSTYDRGSELLLGTYNLLDLTPLGRQEDWEEPSGRSDGPMMSWLRRHDRYEVHDASADGWAQ